MKNVLRVVAGIYTVALLVALLATSCAFPDSTIELNESNNNGYDPAINTLLTKTSVRLFDGVKKSDVTLTFEGQVEKLSASLSQKYGRSVGATEKLPITSEDISALIEEQLTKLNIPELIEPSSGDIALINKDFPDLSEEDTIAELETIQKVYQNQVGSLVFNAIIANPDYQPESSISRATGYNDGAFYYDDTQVTVYEIGAALLHAFSAVTLSQQREKAFQLTEKYMGAKDRTDDKSDAFRHAILNIVMAKEGWGLKGEKMAWARDFSTAHEKGVKYTGIPSEMDLHNNNVGLGITTQNLPRNI
ncbi:MAG: hypothetical protein LBK73_16045 [Treponema sp.]|jgi:hypothetical protein|nr:hypothetical protein [Treponema sp.]